MNKYHSIVITATLIVTAGCSLAPRENAAEVLERSMALVVPAEDIFSPSPQTESNSLENTTPMTYNTEAQYIATLKTSQGDIEITLNKGETPRTVQNFVELSQKKFYDGTIFHRAIKGFMIQGGDPEGTGMGGPGYRFDDEPFSGEYLRGTVAMANAGPNTNGSQFFIMHADYPLPKNYTIFGRVTRGMEVVDTIATADVQYSKSGELSQPVSPIVVNTVDIRIEE